MLLDFLAGKQGEYISMEELHAGQQTGYDVVENNYIPNGYDLVYPEGYPNEGEVYATIIKKGFGKPYIEYVSYNTI